jgi:hypothetical protein
MCKIESNNSIQNYKRKPAMKLAWGKQRLVGCEPYTRESYHHDSLELWSEYFKPRNGQQWDSETEKYLLNTQSQWVKVFPPKINTEANIRYEQDTSDSESTTESLEAAAQEVEEILQSESTTATVGSPSPRGPTPLLDELDYPSTPEDHSIWEDY